MSPKVDKSNKFGTKGTGYTYTCKYRLIPMFELKFPNIWLTCFILYIESRWLMPTNNEIKVAFVIVVGKAVLWLYAHDHKKWSWRAISWSSILYKNLGITRKLPTIVGFIGYYSFNALSCP